ncbi:MAG TPA: ribosome maturation factor RimM [Gammaproteobacteria bacterium]|nr:ribosome maturation factor RimM [Gammaproteobacteria bacterium]
MPGVIPEFAIVGRVRRAHGIRGELVVETMTDAPDVIFASGARVFQGTAAGDVWRDPKSGELRELTVLASRPFKGGLLVTLDAVADRTEAERWNDRHLLVPMTELSEPKEGELFLHELGGMRVLDEAGASLGEVRGWFQVPHGVLLDVHTHRGDVALPFNQQFVRDVNRAGRTLTVAIPDELFTGGE